MNRQDLINSLVEEEGVYPALADRIVDRMFNSILASLLDGDRVLINKICSMKIVDAKPRKARDIRRGVDHIIPARKRLKFKTSAILRRLMDEKLSAQ